ncbi:MAG: tyrosine-type recombinase/integrase [Verrucomicrobia bacterium]|jgi:integrase|nr:tyrosine-type recombinase/integrase [Verrucomicrobiota bacterium]
MTSKSLKKKRGPIEVIEGKGIKVPIYSSPVRGVTSFQLSYYKEGKRDRERTSSIESARKRARELIEELASGKAHGGVTFSAAQAAVLKDVGESLKAFDVPISRAVREYVEALRILKGQGTLSEAAQFFVREDKKRKIPQIKFKELMDKYLLSITDNSYRYKQDTQARLRLAVKSFSTDVQDITTTKIDEWLDSIKARGRTRNNYRTSLASLFTYARNQGYLPENERTAVERVKKVKATANKAPGIYTPKEIKNLLSSIDDRWVPFVSIAAFTGMRSAELHRLDWKDVWLEKGYIEVAAQKAKTASRRLVPILPNLKAWLTRYKDKTGETPCPRFAHDSTLMSKFSQSADLVGFARVHNGFRHSFASYRLAQTQNAAQVALEMGNSPRKLFENYRELVTPEDAEEWFGIMPGIRKKPGNGQVDDSGKKPEKKGSAKKPKKKASPKDLVPGSSSSRSYRLKKLAAPK